MMTMQFILPSCAHASQVSPVMPKGTRKSTANQGLVQSDSVVASIVRANMDNLIILSGAGAECLRKNRRPKHAGHNCYHYSDLTEDSVDFDTDNLLQAPSEDIACVHGVGK